MITRQHSTFSDPAQTEYTLAVEFSDNVVTVKAGSFREAGVAYTLNEDETASYTPGTPMFGYLVQDLVSEDFRVVTWSGGVPPDWEALNLKLFHLLFLVHAEGEEVVLEQWATVPIPVPVPSPKPDRPAPEQQPEPQN